MQTFFRFPFVQMFQGGYISCKEGEVFLICNKFDGTNHDVLSPTEPKKIKYLGITSAATTT